MKKLILVVLVFVLVLPFSFANQNCMTREEVGENRELCLYIYEGKVYSLGYYGSEHHKHECGTDVTAVMRNTHIENPEHYLDDFYKADLCEGYVADDEQDSLPLLPFMVLILLVAAIIAGALFYLFKKFKAHRK